MSGGPTPAGSVEFRDYLTVFKRQFVLILAVVVLGGVAAGAYSFRRTPLYESTASVLVRAITTNAFDPGQRVDQQLNMFNQRQLALSEPVAAVAAKQLGTTATPQQLIKHVAADVPANSQIVRIHYRDTVPLSAQRGADAFAKAYLAFREAEARTQAAASQRTLQKDIGRLQQELTRAEAIVAEIAGNRLELIESGEARDLPEGVAGILASLCQLAAECGTDHGGDPLQPLDHFGVVAAEAHHLAEPFVDGAEGARISFPGEFAVLDHEERHAARGDAGHRPHRAEMMVRR